MGHVSNHKRVRAEVQGLGLPLERDYCWANFVGFVNFERIDGEPEVALPGRWFWLPTANPYQPLGGVTQSGELGCNPRGGSCRSRTHVRHSETREPAPASAARKVSSGPASAVQAALVAPTLW